MREFFSILPTIVLSTVLFACTAEEPDLGSVRLISAAENGCSVDQMITATSATGWTAKKGGDGQSVTLVPPSDYSPEKFDDLLASLESLSCQFGLQLLDVQGRAVGPDGRPIE